MRPRSTPICGFLMVGLALLLAGPAPAQLVRDSPFRSRTAAVVDEAAKLPLEFCGFIQTRDGLQFRVRDPQRKRAAFLQLNVAEPELGVVARRYDAEGETLVVEYEGRTLNLPQQIAKVKSAAAMVPPPSRALPVTAPNVFVHPPRRPMTMEEVQAEIIRRQEERKRAESAETPPTKARSGR